MKTRHSLDRIIVERRAIPPNGSVTIELPFPPATRSTTSSGDESHAHHLWREQAAEAICEQRPRCVLGSVEICVTLEDRSEFREVGNLTANILDALVHSRVISDAKARTVRSFALKWSAAQHSGARVEIFAAGAA